MRPHEMAWEGLLEQYAEFAGVDREDVRENYVRRMKLINEEWWGLAAAGWVERAQRFYGISRYYILELLGSGPTAEYMEDKMFAMGVGEWLDSEAQMDVLEVGPGLGFAAEVFAKRGHRVVCVECPGEGRGFAEWRLRDAGLSIRWIGPDELAGEEVMFDLVYTDAVMEHLVDPYGDAEVWARRMRPGGVMFHGIDVVNRGVDWPMHRWVDLVMLDRVMERCGGRLKARSNNGVCNLWQFGGGGNAPGY